MSNEQWAIHDYEQNIIKIEKNNTLVMFWLENLSVNMSIDTNGF